VLALALWALNAFTKVSPQKAAVVLKTGGGVGALAIAGLLGVRGRFDIAVPLGLAGLGLLGWLPWSVPGLTQRTRKSAGQVSRVRAAFVEMELDHDTGAMRGRILAGRHEGVTLDALDLATQKGILAVIQNALEATPPDGVVEASLPPGPRRLLAAAGRDTMSLGNRRVPLEPAARLFRDGDLYIDVHCLGELLGTPIVVDWSELSATVMDVAVLPIGQRAQRDAARAALARRRRRVSRAARSPRKLRHGPHHQHRTIKFFWKMPSFLTIIPVGDKMSACRTLQ